MLCKLSVSFIAQSDPRQALPKFLDARDPLRYWMSDVKYLGYYFSCVTEYDAKIILTAEYLGVFKLQQSNYPTEYWQHIIFHSLK